MQFSYTYAMPKKFPSFFLEGVTQALFREWATYSVLVYALPFDFDSYKIVSQNWY